MSNDLYKAVWERGINSEKEVIEFLREFYPVAIPSKKSNVLGDIDVWLLPDEGCPRVGVSIKTEHAAAHTGNLSFELKYYRADTRDWRLSWFYLGKADWYIIRVGYAVYKIVKDNLDEYIAEHGWYKQRTLNKTGKAYESQQGTNITQSLNGLVPLSTLLELNIAEYLGECDGQQLQIT